MPNKSILITLLLFAFSFSAFAQKNKDEDKEKTESKKDLVVENASIIKKPIDPLSPARAAFYSAVLPGLGHAHLKQYWKIPVIYAGLGAGVYFYIDNNKQYNRYRDAYKRRLAGFEDDEFFGEITDDGLQDAQKQFSRNREISMLVTIGIYVLNVVWANVDAHLMQFNVDDDLSLKPHYKLNEYNLKGDVGLTLNYKF